MATLLVLLAIGVCVASLVAFAAMTLAPSEESLSAEERLDLMAAQRRKNGSSPNASLLLSTDFGQLENRLNSLAAKIPNVGMWIEQSGLQTSAGMILAKTIGCAVGLGAIAMILPIPVFFMPLFVCFGLVIPGAYVWYKRAKRLSLFGRQLPDALDLLGRSLRSGHSLPAGFSLVGTEMKDPLAAEFYRVFEEQNLGIPLEDALDQMANRVPNLDLRFFATAVILQRMTGGDLAEILEKISTLIRARLKLLGTIAALTGEGRISGSVLLSMPPALFIYMFLVNPDYVMPLFTDELGKYMIFGAVIMQLLGAVAIKKIITIKV